MPTIPFRIDDETKRLAMQAAGQASQGGGMPDLRLIQNLAETA